MESKVLKPTPGQIETVSIVFPNQMKRGQSQVQTVDTERMTDAECSELDEALEYQCLILSIKHISRKTIFQCGSFLVGAGSGYVY